jgi:hypothetical protein
VRATKRVRGVPSGTYDAEGMRGMLGKGTDVCKDPNDQRAALLLITGIDSLACVCSRVEYACMHACERMTGRHDDYSEPTRKIAVQREAQGTWATRGNREQFHSVPPNGRGRSESRKTSEETDSADYP